MKDSKINLLLAIGLVAALGAMISSFAAGSHFEISSRDGARNYDIKVGAGNSSATSSLGLIALVAFVATIGLHLSKPNTGPGSPATGTTPASANGFEGFAEGLRRLTKSKTDVWVGGVCGGLGEHTPLPSWVWRVIFLFCLFCYGIGGPLYLCLWICLPQASDDPRMFSRPPRPTPFGTK